MACDRYGPAMTMNSTAVSVSPVFSVSPARTNTASTTSTGATSAAWR